MDVPIEIWSAAEGGTKLGLFTHTMCGARTASVSVWRGFLVARGECHKARVVLPREPRGTVGSAFYMHV